MLNLTKSEKMFWLSFLLSLILLLSGTVFSWLNDNFFVWLESKMPYKWMLTILTMITLSAVFLWLYSLTFSSNQLNVVTKDIPEKNCPKCGEPKLEVTKSTIRVFEYKCRGCAFEHRTLKKGQTNKLNKSK